MWSQAKRCAVADVEGQIKELTDQHTTGAAFISTEALYIRVVRRDGLQLSLIDLPGVTHNAEKMSNIHEVTVSLVKEYIEPEEMVILCVIPAMSDFGNAEVVKLAREYDPEGIRTLGVVTKCDDAANAEASDIVEKVTMSRDSDVRLAFGFHCVVNRSQKNIDEGMSREDLWQKEEKTFTASDRKLPANNWGTLRLMEKVAKIQEARVDECLPKIKESVRQRTIQLREELRSLPAQAEAEGDQFKLFNSTVRLIKDDLQRRIRAEFMSSDESDSALTIAPQVAKRIQQFRRDLAQRNPEWLGPDMIEEVKYTVALLGTAGAKLKEEEPQLTPEFVDLVKQAQEEPEKLAVLELCASLHVYTGFLIEGFVEHAAKLLKFNMVEHLGETLEDTWREELGGSALHELFPKDEGIARQREALMACMRTLQDFKEQLSTLKVAAPVPTHVPAKRKTMSDSLQDREKARKEELAARTFVWNFAAALEGKEAKKGTRLDSPKFTKMMVPDMYLSFYPYGDDKSADGKSALFLHSPAGWTLSYRLRAGGVEVMVEGWKFDATEAGYGGRIFPAVKAFSTQEVSVELLKAVPP
ncbi:DRP4C [Symbiodinium microadriaticum]|nr:DRP4C [Symbiodinium microadriaticum]